MAVLPFLFPGFTRLVLSFLPTHPPKQFSSWRRPKGYTIVGRISSGGSGVVYRLKKVGKEDGVFYAGKQMDFPHKDRNRKISLIREFYTTRLMSGFDQTVSLIDLAFLKKYEDIFEIILIFEFVGGETLRSIIRRPFLHVKLSDGDCVDLIKQLLFTSNVLHHYKLIHRDSKPENFIVNLDSMKLTMIDFGVSRIESHAKHARYLSTQNVFTDGYQPPELISAHCYDSKADVWAIGAMVYELLKALELSTAGAKEELPLHDCMLWPPSNASADENIQYLRQKVATLDAELPSQSDVVISFLKKLLRIDPKKRPTAAEALEAMGSESGMIPDISKEKLEEIRDYETQMTILNIREATFTREKGKRNIQLGKCGKKERKQLMKAIKSLELQLAEIDTERKICLNKQMQMELATFTYNWNNGELIEELNKALVCYKPSDPNKWFDFKPFAVCMVADERKRESEEKEEKEEKKVALIPAARTGQNTLLDVKGYVNDFSSHLNDKMTKHSQNVVFVVVDGDITSAIALALVEYARTMDNSPVRRVVAICFPDIYRENPDLYEKCVNAVKSTTAELHVVQYDDFKQLSTFDDPETAYQNVSLQRQFVEEFGPRLTQEESSECFVIGQGNGTIDLSELNLNEMRTLCTLLEVNFENFDWGDDEEEDTPAPKQTISADEYSNKHEIEIKRETDKLKSAKEAEKFEKLRIEKEQCKAEEEERDVDIAKGDATAAELEEREQWKKDRDKAGNERMMKMNAERDENASAARSVYDDAAQMPANPNVIDEDYVPQPVEPKPDSPLPRANKPPHQDVAVGGGQPSHVVEPPQIGYQVGDECQAVFEEDGAWYAAEIAAVGQGTFGVKFTEYDDPTVYTVNADQVKDA